MKIETNIIVPKEIVNALLCLHGEAADTTEVEASLTIDGDDLILEMDGYGGYEMILKIGLQSGAKDRLALLIECGC
jgi:hypothetical protein